MGTTFSSVHREPWNNGKIVGQSAPFKQKIWARRVRLQMENRIQELAHFNRGIGKIEFRFSRVKSEALHPTA